jgi:hypothetical protein
MFFFARPPSCFPFTGLLTFRVTRASQPPQRPKISRQFPAHVISTAHHPTRPDSLRFLTRHKSSGFILLRTLGRRQISQLLCNQANPNSSYKIPGVGYHSDTAAVFANSLACHTYKITPRKSFPCHTYKKGGWPTILNDVRPHSSATSRYNPQLNSLTGASG